MLKVKQSHYQMKVTLSNHAGVDSEVIFIRHQITNSEDELWIASLANIEGRQI